MSRLTKGRKSLVRQPDREPDDVISLSSGSDEEPTTKKQKTSHSLSKKENSIQLDESESTEEENHRILIKSHDGPYRFITWVVWDKENQDPDCHTRTARSPFISLKDEPVILAYYGWTKDTLIQVWSVRLGGWEEQLVSDVHLMTIADDWRRILVKGPGVGAVKGFFEEGLEMLRGPKACLGDQVLRKDRTKRVASWWKDMEEGKKRKAEFVEGSSKSSS